MQAHLAVFVNIHWFANNRTVIQFRIFVFVPVKSGNENESESDRKEIDIDCEREREIIDKRLASRRKH